MGRGRAVVIPVVIAVGIAATVASSVASPPPADYDLPVGWTTQFGTFEQDTYPTIARGPSGDIYVTAQTTGSFPGFTNPNFNVDAALARFDKNGNRLWLQQFGSTGHDQIWDIVVSAVGDIFVVGTTKGDLDGTGPGPIGDIDGFVARFDKNGVRTWIRQMGIPGEGVAFKAAAVAGSNDLYVVGQLTGDFDGAGSGVHSGAFDALLLRFDRKGTVKWARQFGTADAEEVADVAVRGSSEIYVTGLTSGDLDGLGGDPFRGLVDSYLMRWDANGNRIWSRQFGTTDWDEGRAVTTFGSNEIYVAGNVQGDLDATGPDGSSGVADAYVSRWDRSGNQIWTRQFGTTENEEVTGLAVASSSAVYVVGSTPGDADGPGGAPAPGGASVFLTRFTNAGTDVSTRAVGTPEADYGAALALTASKRPIVAANTAGTVWGHANTGSIDLFVMVLPA